MKRLSSSAEAHLAYRSAARFYRRPYVTGLAIGEPVRGAEYRVDELAICIHVREKVPEAHLSKSQVFPREINGVPVDVCERIFTARGLSPEERLARQFQPANPAAPGVQIGVSGGVPGSFGMIVYDRTDGAACLLSAAHVLVGEGPQVVYQPGVRNGLHPIGTLSRSMLNREGDAAIARLDQMRSVDPMPTGLATPITSVRRVRAGDILSKSGAETGVTRGRVTKLGAFDVDYDFGSIRMKGFELRPVHPTDESEISDGGDSGSVWYEETTGEAVGLTVAGDGGPADADEYTFACHLDLVFTRLGVAEQPQRL